MPLSRNSAARCFSMSAARSCAAHGRKGTSCWTTACGRACIAVGVDAFWTPSACRRACLLVRGGAKRCGLSCTQHPLSTCVPWCMKPSGTKERPTRRCGDAVPSLCQRGRRFEAGRSGGVAHTTVFTVRCCPAPASANLVRGGAGGAGGRVALSTVQCTRNTAKRDPTRRTQRLCVAF